MGLFQKMFCGGCRRELARTRDQVKSANKLLQEARNELATLTRDHGEIRNRLAEAQASIETIKASGPPALVWCSDKDNLWRFKLLDADGTTAAICAGRWDTLDEAVAAAKVVSRKVTIQR